MYQPHPRDPLQLLGGVHLPGDEFETEPSSPPAVTHSRPQGPWGRRETLIQKHKTSLPTLTLASWSFPGVLLITHSTVPQPGPCPYLLHVLLGPKIGRVHERPHDLYIAVDDQCLIWPVGVDAHTAMVEDRIWQLRPLPQHVTVTFKLAWVRGLWQVGSGSVLGVGQTLGA